MASTEWHSSSPGHAKELIRVIVVDDHPVFRKGLVEVIMEARDFMVCAEASTVTGALRLVAEHHPDVAIVDLALGDEDGLALVTSLTETYPDVGVLVLSGHDERLHADRALKAGALGYVMKDKAAEELLRALRLVAGGRPYVSESTADRILTALGGGRRTTASPLERLSDRERRVLTLMGNGRTTREIAEVLGLSVKTVESHYAHIKEKLGLQHGRELMRVAVTWAEGHRPQ